MRARPPWPASKKHTVEQPRSLNDRKSVNTVLAINGDYYGARDAGYVVRNGQLLRSPEPTTRRFSHLQDGSFGIVKKATSQPNS